MSPRLKSAEKRAEVVVVRPALMRDRDAAAFLARSPSWIRQIRAEDAKALRAGRDPAGPRWITIGSSVFYKITDLDEWIERHAVERGVVAFSNRGGGQRP